MNVCGVIPARGGSKSIPRKNLAQLAGRSLLAHGVKCARRCQSLDRFVVSTEDPEIKAAARNLDVKVVDRPRELATDEARTEPVLLHAVDTLSDQGYEVDVVVTLEPTSPLRRPETVDRCVRRFLEGDCDAVFTVVPNHAIVGRLEGERFYPFLEDPPRRRQERETLYEESSTIYVTDVEALRITGSVLGSDPVALIVDEEEAVDIDNPIDLAFAEATISVRREEAR